MSAIYGMVSTGERIPDEALLTPMQAALAPRGAHHHAAHQAHAALGQISHAALSALLTNESRTVTLVFEGSITNYRELREDLLGLGHTFASAYPAEVIVHLYEEQGADALTFLRGPFALALWDAKTKRLLLACDPLSQTTLAYTSHDQGLLFASEMAALCSQPDVPRQAPFEDHAVLVQALYTGSLPIDQTILRDIHTLPAGHGLIWSVEEPAPRLFCYWQGSTLAPLDPKASIVDYEDAVREHLANSVRLHVGSDETVGVLLSGGINSSLVAAMMPHQNRTLHAFTLRFEDRETPETKRAAEIAKYIGAEHTVLSLTKPDLSHILPRLIWHTGQPLIAPHMLLMALLSEAVAGQAHVLLTGIGGMLLLGNPFPEKTPRPRPMWQTATTFLQRARIARQKEAQRETDALALLAPNEIEALIGHAPQVAVPPVPTLERQSEMVAALPIRHFMPAQQIGAAHGLDLRFPFADTYVIEAAAHIPLNLKHRPGKPFYVLHEAAYGLLPAALLNDPIPPQTLPLAQWLRDQQAYVREVLLGKRAKKRGLLQISALTSLIDSHMGGQDHSAALLALLSLEVWQRLFIDPPKIKPPFHDAK